MKTIKFIVLLCLVFIYSCQSDFQDKNESEKLSTNELISMGNFNFETEGVLEFKIPKEKWDKIKDQVFLNEEFFRELGDEIDKLHQPKIESKSVEFRNDIRTQIGINTPCHPFRFITGWNVNLSRTRFCNKNGRYILLAQTSFACNSDSFIDEIIWTNEYEEDVMSYVSAKTNCTSETELDLW